MSFVANVEKSFGIFLQEWGNRLKNDVKTDRILSYISVSPFSIWSIIYMVDSGIKLILAIIFGVVPMVILVSLLFGLFLALFKFIGSLLNKIGGSFIRQSQTARFSCKIISDVKKYVKAEYFVEIKNGEWFADATDVKCHIEIGPTAEDYEDREIYTTFKHVKEQKPVPILIIGKWISETEETTDIKKGKSKIARFIKADIPNDEIIVFGNSANDGKPSDVSLPPRKRIFFVSANGRIKGGSFSTRFQILVTYKGKDEVDVKINGNENVVVEIIPKKSETVLFA